MKKQIKTWMTVIAFTFIASNGFAQEETNSAPRWVSERGYWVVESNTHTPLHSIIRFYTNDDVLVYTENVDGVKLNPANRRLRMKLKTVLEASVVAWEKTKKPEANKDYVTAVLK